jgi:enoyl-CoA hydratase
LRIGLVNEVTPPAELIPRAEAIARKIIGNAPLAVQYAMEAVNKGMEMTLAEGLYLEATLFGVCCASEDKTEGTTAFLEKRQAKFKGK